MPKLNKYQEAIVNAPIDQNMCVIASAGSGKTFTMIHRIERLVNEGVDPSGIVAVMFNRDAAKGGKERLEKMIGKKSGVTVKTVDAYAKALCEAIDDGTLIPKDVHVSEYLEIVLEQLQADNKELKKLLSSVSHLFFDEFQDIDNRQQLFVDYLEGQGTIICCIGDDSQCINEWRYADPKYIRQAFEKYTPYSLPINYRSSQSIVALANEIVSMDNDRIKEKMPMEAREDAEKGDMPLVINCDKRRYAKRFEFSYILTHTKSLLSKGILPSEIAVLIPSNRNINDFFRGGTKDDQDAELAEEISKVFSDDEDAEDKVRVMTIHKSKGLEFEYVFLARMSPFWPWYCNDILENEYRRVFYVGVTRAKKGLFITYVHQSKKPTRFVQELSGDFFETYQYDHQRNLSTFGERKPELNKWPMKVTELVRGLSGRNYREIREHGIANLDWVLQESLSDYKRQSWGNTKRSRQRLIGKMFERYVEASALAHEKDAYMVREKRFRPLFERANEYARLYLPHRHLKPQERYSHTTDDELTIVGYPDFVRPGEVHELKFTISPLAGDYTLQILLYVALMRLNGETVNTVCLYNGMQKTCYTADVTRWDHRPLVDYLLECAVARKMRTFLLEEE